MLTLRHRQTLAPGFWRIPPERTDPAQLSQRGVEFASKNDGPGMLRTGWAIWQTAGLHSTEAADLIAHGYQLWRSRKSFDAPLGLSFLSDLLETLTVTTPLGASSSGDDAVARVHFGLRCWAGLQLLGMAPPQSRQEIERRVYDAITSSPRQWVPDDAAAFARGYAEAHELVLPWDGEQAPETAASTADAVATESARAARPSPKPRPRPTPAQASAPTQVSAPIPQAIQPSSPPPAPPAPSPQPVAHSPAVEHPQPVEPPHPVVPTQASPPEAPAAENEPPVGEPPVSQPTGSQPTVVAPIVTHSHSPDPEPPAEPSRVIRVESAELRGLRETCIRWLSDTYSDVEVEENGWIRLRGVSGSDIFVECSELAGNRRRLEIFAPVLFDVPLSQELLEHVAYDGAKFPLGGLSIDAEPNDDLGLLQFSYRVLVDILSPYHLISVVDLVAASARREAEELQPRFGGVPLAEYAIS